eukprot:CAMPEP_0170430980 /NCGR_PEP_ID=MMETSP0117_2-20130122/41153_1 /TAXON_ID=400756 /ORGANISM="Durinskia baltica, Strain CSIRO CS-38" /LENGTH=209 /DNA_ID=CAMNT_0010690497 /DNA_START=1 /DNA_END=630 /DNA_ORIENTATION=-
MSGTCTRAGMPARFATNERFQQIAMQMKATISILSNPAKEQSSSAQVEEEPGFIHQSPPICARDLRDIKALFNKSQQAVKLATEERRSMSTRTSKDTTSPDEPGESVLVKLATTLHNAGVHMRKTLQAMDVDGNGLLTEDDWGAGLELLHCTTFEAYQAWTLINPEHHEEVPIADIENLLRRALWRKGRSICGSGHSTRASLFIRSGGD